MIQRFKDEYEFLSNFYPSKVILDGREYPTVENAYQAAKTLDMSLRIQISKETPGRAKRIGKKITPSHWGDVKERIMLDLLRQKFSQEPLRSKLTLTGKEVIQEGNLWGDTYWGVCKGVGENRLGILLMKVRTELRASL